MDETLLKEKAIGNLSAEKIFERPSLPGVFFPFLEEVVWRYFTILCVFHAGLPGATLFLPLKKQVGEQLKSMTKKSHNQHHLFQVFISNPPLSQV